MFIHGMEPFLLYLFASLSIAFVIMVIRARNPGHSVLFLILVFCNAAGLLLLFGLDFFAVVYVGAIAVLFLFVAEAISRSISEAISRSISEAIDKEIDKEMEAIREANWKANWKANREAIDKEIDKQMEAIREAAIDKEIDKQMEAIREAAIDEEIDKEIWEANWKANWKAIREEIDKENEEDFEIHEKKREQRRKSLQKYTQEIKGASKRLLPRNKVLKTRSQRLDLSGKSKIRVRLVTTLALAHASPRPKSLHALVPRGSDPSLHHLNSPNLHQLIHGKNLVGPTFVGVLERNKILSPFLYGRTGALEILDIDFLLPQMKRVRALLLLTFIRKGNILIISNDPLHSQILQEVSKRSKQILVVSRWTHGLLTNWKQVQPHFFQKHNKKRPLKGTKKYLKLCNRNRKKKDKVSTAQGTHKFMFKSDRYLRKPLYAFETKRLIQKFRSKLQSKVVKPNSYKLVETVCHEALARRLMAKRLVMQHFLNKNRNLKKNKNLKVKKKKFQFFMALEYFRKERKKKLISAVLKNQEAYLQVLKRKKTRKELRHKELRHKEFLKKKKSSLVGLPKKKKK